MAKRLMVLKLTNVAQPNAEGVTLDDGNSWKSPPAGWLPVQAGAWDQLPDGVHLHDPQKKEPRIALLQGLNFLTSKKDDVGKAQYPRLGDSGNWTVVDVVSS